MWVLKLRLILNMKNDSHIHKIRVANIGSNKMWKGGIFWEHVIVIVACDVQKQNVFSQHDDRALFCILGHKKITIISF